MAYNEPYIRKQIEKIQLIGAFRLFIRSICERVISAWYYSIPACVVISFSGMRFVQDEYILGPRDFFYGITTLGCWGFIDFMITRTTIGENTPFTCFFIKMSHWFTKAFPVLAMWINLITSRPNEYALFLCVSVRVGLAHWMARRILSISHRWLANICLILPPNGMQTIFYLHKHHHNEITLHILYSLNWSHPAIVKETPHLLCNKRGRLAFLPDCHAARVWHLKAIYSGVIKTIIVLTIGISADSSCVYKKTINILTLALDLFSPLMRREL